MATALGQIVAWGILYYAFTVVVDPMQAGTDWSRTFLNSGLSLGLLAWGICALPVGAWIQRKGGRELMTAASALGGAALVLMGSVPDRTVYFVPWLMLGSAMAGMLYDSAFAVVTRAFGPQYRRGIALITLVGGLASTVFIPVAQLAVNSLGWQHALIALGVFHFALGVPLHWFGVPRGEQCSAVAPAEPVMTRWRHWWREFRRDVSDLQLLLSDRVLVAFLEGLLEETQHKWRVLGAQQSQRERRCIEIIDGGRYAGRIPRPRSPGSS